MRVPSGRGSPSYQRWAAASRPSSDSTRGRPRPSSQSASRSDVLVPGGLVPLLEAAGRRGAGAARRRRDVPGARRSDHGSHGGGSSAPSPGSRLTSLTVTVLRARRPGQGDDPAPPAVRLGVQANEWLTTRSPSASTPWCSPTAPGSATPGRPRARRRRRRRARRRPRRRGFGGSRWSRQGSTWIECPARVRRSRTARPERSRDQPLWLSGEDGRMGAWNATRSTTPSRSPARGQAGGGRVEAGRGGHRTPGAPAHPRAGRRRVRSGEGHRAARRLGGRRRARAAGAGQHGVLLGARGRGARAGRPVPAGDDAALLDPGADPRPAAGPVPARAALRAGRDLRLAGVPGLGHGRRGGRRKEGFALYPAAFGYLVATKAYR